MSDNSIPLFLLTFNCGKTKQTSSDVKDFLSPQLPQEAPFLIVVGFEEVAPIMDGCFNAVDDYLESLLSGVNSAIDSRYYQKYYRVGKSIKGGIALVVLALEEQVKIGRVLVANAGVGYFKSGLKGAAALRIQMTAPVDAEFTFANAHLAANEGFVAQRNLDFFSIAQALEFGDGYGLYKRATHTFFMGDLNYRATKDLVIGSTRIDGAGSDEDAERLLPTLDTEQIQQHDELSTEMSKDAVLWGFEEPHITFPPSYKFIVGTDKYASSKRISSWCDRILYLKYTTPPKVLSYNSITASKNSDHKPVYLSIVVSAAAPVNVLTSDHFLDNGKKDIYLGISSYQSFNRLYGEASDKAIGWGLYISTTPRGRTLGAYGAAAAFVLYLIWFLWW